MRHECQPLSGRLQWARHMPVQRKRVWRVHLPERGRPYCLCRQRMRMYVLWSQTSPLYHAYSEAPTSGNLLGCATVDGVECGENAQGCDGCTGKCLCNDGWVQPSLENGCVCEAGTDVCMDALGLVCGGHGMHMPARSCDVACGLVPISPSPQSWVGTCNTGVCGCNCQRGWKGATCSECDAEAAVEATVNEGGYCNGELVLTNGFTCTQSTCMSFCNATTCNDCAKLYDAGCAWCGATQTCTDPYTAEQLCNGQSSRVNESCNANSILLPAAIGGAAAAAVLFAAGLLLFKVCICSATPATTLLL